MAKIDVKGETPVDHGEIICFSIHSGPEADFGNGKSCIWVDVLDGGGKEILFEFEPFFNDQSIKKVNFPSYNPHFSMLLLHVMIKIACMKFLVNFVGWGTSNFW